MHEARARRPPEGHRHPGRVCRYDPRLWRVSRPGRTRLPAGHTDHRLLLVTMGVYLLDGVRLDQLASTAARLKRWEFLLIVAPRQVPGSTGSPVNPLAMF
jgi:hypothetical protein